MVVKAYRQGRLAFHGQVTTQVQGGSARAWHWAKPLDAQATEFSPEAYDRLVITQADWSVNEARRRGSAAKKLILSISNLDQALEHAEERWDKEHHDCSNAQQAVDLAEQIIRDTAQEFGLNDKDHEQLGRHLLASAVELYGEPDEDSDYAQMRDDLESGDCVTINADNEVYFGRRLFGRIGDDEDDDFTWEEAWNAIGQEMERQGYFPNVYSVNDHGNVTQHGAGGEVLNAWV
jgi:hypothetical protein